MPTSSRRKNRTTRKQRKREKLNVARSFTSTSLPQQSFVDFQQTVTPTATPVQYSMLSPILSSTGILQQFPAHAKPYYRNGAFGLRQRITLLRVELTYQVIGAQSNAILSADIYNTVRLAVFSTGVSYLDTNAEYLTGTLTGPNPDQARRIYYDKVHVLMTNAWNASSGYNSPGVQTVQKSVPLNMVLDTSSTTTSGSGTDWRTDGSDLIINYVSDSSVSPHPTVQLTARIYFKYN